MTDVQEIPITDTTTFALFDITDMYTNIPMQKLSQIINDICDQTLIPQEVKREHITLVHTILKQNYFQFQEQIYKQITGLAMGAPFSPTFSEIYLQYIDHSTIYEILLKHNILDYFRYVDDNLIVYNTKKTDITEVINRFIKATHPLQFTIEKQKNNQINFLDITIKERTQPNQIRHIQKTH
jgi:septum formation topological specificity factor MinE